MKALLLLSLLLLNQTPTKTVLYLKGDVTEEALAPLFKQLQAVKEATLIITTPGGSVSSGLLFAQAVEGLRAEGLVVHCVGDLFVLSMGAVLLESGLCDDRSVTDRTIMLFHKSHNAVPTPTEDEMLKAIDYIVAVTVGHRSGMSPQAFLARIEKGAWILLPGEALTAKLVDRVISPPG